MRRQNLGYYISVIYRHMQIHLNKEFNEFGFGSGQYMFFIHISHEEGITQKEISKDLAIDKGTTAKAVSRLIELGYITAKVNSKDQRSHKLYLTKSGKAILPKVQDILSKTSDIMKTGMNTSEKLNALSSLRKIGENMIKFV